MFYFWPPPAPSHDPYPEMTPPRAAAAAAAATTITTFLWQIGVATAMKLLLLPAYHSTDLEVHRNWLAITGTLPLSDWYSPSSPDSNPSPWTLDYPPFFAYFQLLLSAFASAVDPIITDLHLGIDYGSPSVVLFQRCTVILADSLLFAGVYLVSRRMAALARRLFWMLVVWSPMLIIVDHVHFQYNGFLLGWLLLSLWFLGEGRDLPGGILFAVLLCFKHLFAVAAPVYLVYLLRRCFVGKGGFARGLGRLTVLGAAVVAVFAAAFVPFVYYGKMHEVISRMFPFGRGLCHAYWAPNFWVFYILSDKLLSFVLRRLGFEISLPAASFTGGLVGDLSPFAVLPQIAPLTTFIMVLLSLSPCLIKAWNNPQPKLVARWIAYAYTCGFLFGWHVHEKAALHFVIPLAIVSVQSREDAKHFFWLSIVSCYSLFPLLYQAQEYPIKVLLLLLSAILMFLGFPALFDTNKASEASDASALGKGGQSEKSKRNRAKKSAFAVGWTVRAYLFGIILIELWGQFLHPYIFGDKFPFVPLMMVSVYCAFGITYSWIWQLRSILISSN